MYYTGSLNRTWYIIIPSLRLLHVVVILIIVVISLGIIFIFNSNYGNIFSMGSSGLEICWTAIPAIIAFITVVPILILISDVESNEYTIVFTIGNQWYWNLNNVDITYNGDFLENMFYSHNVERILLTSTDVIHDFRLSYLGIKLDANPRWLQYNELPLDSTLYYGNCSELCGLLHSYMPILVI